MAYQARLLAIENDREVTANTDPEFWYTYQISVLLALREQGVLDEAQYRYAEERLRRQRNRVTTADAARPLYSGFHEKISRRRPGEK